MKVLETINFTHELDLLEAHLEEHVFMDTIVVAESEITYSGMSKPLYFQENKKRFEKFNVIHEIVPKELFILIPGKYPEEERKKWFDARRVNRERQIAYLFHKYKTDHDYVCTADVDEIWAQQRWYVVLGMMEQDYLYIAPKVKVFFHFLDAPARTQDHWRIAHASMPGPVRQKGIKRGATPQEVGWHFTTCFKDPKDIWMKGVGIAQSIGYLGWENTPSAEVCADKLKEGLLPFIDEQINPYRVMPKNDLSWLPSYMQRNPSKFPWLEERFRTDKEVSAWKL